METSERFTKETIMELATAISDHGGNEIFAVGAIDRNGLVYRVNVVARGNEGRVPVLMSFAEKGDVVIHNHPSGTLKPSGPDIGIAAELGQLGIGFYIIDNRISRVTVVAEPVMAEIKTPLDGAALKALLMPGGAFNAIYPDYEERTSQIDMLEQVAQAFNEDRILLAEAGTGVGKSLAYLIPALHWVLQNRERVVVSTATINLQEQLLEKDIPLVQKLLKNRIKVELVKGRGNYLCLARLQDAIEEYSLFEERNEELLSIKEWSLTTKNGSRDDLNFFPSDSVWSEVCSEADACSGIRCRHREDCFVLKRRREAACAQVLVVNHHLLFSDIAVRLEGSGFESTAVLPPFSRIIFDEAHNIEKSATSFFSESLSKFTVRKIANRLYREKKGKVSGLSVVLHHKALQMGILERISPLVNHIMECAQRADALALNLLKAEKSIAVSDCLAGDCATFLFEPLGELAGSIMDLVNAMEDVLKKLNFPGDDEDSAELSTRIQLKRLVAVVDLIGALRRHAEHPDKVFWLEGFKSYRGEPAVRFFMTPLDISGLMREAFYEPYATLVFTSATLQVGTGFDYWKSRTGLKDYDRRPLFEKHFPSPFPYKSRVLLSIPCDAPLPDQDDYESFLKEFILAALSLSEGKGLVLFTSYEVLNRVYLHVKEGLHKLGIEVLKQGDDERSRLLRRFNIETSSVLFATDSFWEGVDAPGETLEVVVLCRLPFRVPSEPVIKARMRRIEALGGNPFFELSLPEAIMRFRQGFGRLMRKKTDKGVVMILDSRIIKKSYGRYFLESLPETDVIIADKKAVLAKVEYFFLRTP